MDEQLDHGHDRAAGGGGVRDDDTSETLAARILAAEHTIYSEAIALILSGDWRVEGRRVIAGKGATTG
ncbi:MAG: hypothetical protein R2762_23425 [Bryobacteraceae bacterium]